MKARSRRLVHSWARIFTNCSINIYPEHKVAGWDLVISVIWLLVGHRAQPSCMLTTQIKRSFIDYLLSLRGSVCSTVQLIHHGAVEKLNFS